jgi:hypothetical protein
MLLGRRCVQPHSNPEKSPAEEYDKIIVPKHMIGNGLAGA